MSVPFTWAQPHKRERDWATLNHFHQVAPNPAAREGWAGALGDPSPAERQAGGVAQPRQAPRQSMESGIDAQTWSELNLNPLFARLDRTLSTPGACCLYRILHQPLIPAAQWIARQLRIRLMGDDPAVRHAVNAALLVDWRGAGRRRSAELTSLLWDDLPPLPHSIWLFRALAAGSLASLVAFALTLHLGWFLLLLAFVIADARVHYREQRRLEGRLGALHQLRHLINAAEKVAAIPAPELSEETASLRTAAQSARKLQRRLNRLLPEFSNAALGDLGSILGEYADIFLLHQVRTFYSCVAELTAQCSALREIFTILGEIDACQSIANWRAQLTAENEAWCEPDLDDAGPSLDITAARHPLLDAPVPNSLTLTLPGAAITGSNMSGKTTFLRTIAVNVVLAQTVCTALAASYSGQRLAVITSMNCADSLLEGKSYYLAEAERLLELVHRAEGPLPVLVLIDEPLAGTNSPERYAASREILRYLAAHRGRVLASTHDVELVRVLAASGLYAPYHFSDSANAEGLSFDYTLHPGLDYHANALAVLRYLGYPEAIVTAAADGHAAFSDALGK